MFTGIIEEIGQIKEFSYLSSGARLVVECSCVLDDMKLGDSIAVDGCCQTVVDFNSNSFTVNVSRETLEVSIFKTYRSGTYVNLERALTPKSRMGGHIVQGHVDGRGIFLKKVSQGGFYELYFEISKDLGRYVVHKGSIALNGVSLTVAEVKDNIFKVAVIPHTYVNTNLRDLQSSQLVNVETDILGRYVEKFLSSNNNVGRITQDFLEKNGFM